MDDALLTAREMLETVTPMKRDCGKICGAACCRAPGDEVAGMLLFPGEEAFYGRPGWQVIRGAAGLLAVCPGRCERAERPLSCRLFPLLPMPGEEGIRVEVDLRAGAVCPLARQERSAMDPAFIEAVREAGEVLAADSRQAAFLHKLSLQQRDLRILKKKFGGDRHV